MVLGVWTGWYDDRVIPNDDLLVLSMIAYRFCILLSLLDLVVFRGVLCQPVHLDAREVPNVDLALGLLDLMIDDPVYLPVKEQRTWVRPHHRIPSYRHKAPVGLHPSCLCEEACSQTSLHPFRHIHSPNPYRVAACKCILLYAHAIEVVPQLLSHTHSFEHRLVIQTIIATPLTRLLTHRRVCKRLVDIVERDVIAFFDSELAPRPVN